MFEVHLILASKNQSIGGIVALQDNCTYIADDLWIYEGDLEFLDADFFAVEKGVVGSLGGLSKKDLIYVAMQSFNFASIYFGNLL